MTLDNREVAILAGPAEMFAAVAVDRLGGEIDTAVDRGVELYAFVRVGFFGDRAEERRFLGALQRRLADRSLPRPGGFFLLPEAPWPSILDPLP